MMRVWYVSQKVRLARRKSPNLRQLKRHHNQHRHRERLLQRNARAQQSRVQDANGVRRMQVGAVININNLLKSKNPKQIVSGF